MATGADRRIGETIANSVTHGVGLAASLIALPLVIFASLKRGDPLQVVGAAVFGLSLVLLYGASTVYHSFPRSSATRVLRMIDHSAIYLLIAGSYTPFALGPLRGPWGWALLAAVWAMALIGIALKSIHGFVRPGLSTTLYIAMGWLSIVAVRPLITHVGAAGFWWLLAGGLCYTGGVVFYATDTRLRYGHAVWHVFVLAGSTCHFFAVLWHSGVRTG
ncbi:MAG: hemolysin III family protein [Gemmatimonadaceae bacterium]|nr:hemolysin III family protein [Gemmatimonadaceae bacterium]